MAAMSQAHARAYARVGTGQTGQTGLRLMVAACILTPHAARASRGRLVTTVRELRDFLYPNGWERYPAKVRAALWTADPAWAVLLYGPESPD